MQERRSQLAKTLKHACLTVLVGCGTSCQTDFLEFPSERQLSIHFITKINVPSCNGHLLPSMSGWDWHVNADETRSHHHRTVLPPGILIGA
jgi:hypothetical protein